MHMCEFRQLDLECRLQIIMKIGLKLLAFFVSSVAIASATSARDGLVGTVRLSHLDPSSFSGRAEVNVAGEWGAMCDRHFSDLDASVVCRQLRCEGGRRAEGAGARTVTGSVPVALHSFNCTGLEARVKDCTYIGADLPGCQHSEVDTTCIPVTGVPQSVHITNVSHTSLWLSWSPPANTFCQKTGGYRVQCSGGGDTPYSTDHNSTEVMVANLLPSMQYQCCVTAYNDAGAREQTSCSQVRRTLPASAASPQNITLSQVTSYSATVSWGPPLSKLQGGQVSGYIITVYRGKKLQQNISTSDTRKTITGLKSFTQYELRLSAKTSTGMGPSSEPVAFKTKIYVVEAGVFAAMTFSIVGIFIPTLITCIAVVSCYRVPRPCYCCWRNDATTSWENSERPIHFYKVDYKRKVVHPSVNHCKEGSDETSQHDTLGGQMLLQFGDQCWKIEEANVLEIKADSSKGNTEELGGSEKDDILQSSGDRHLNIIEMKTIPPHTESTETLKLDISDGKEFVLQSPNNQHQDIEKLGAQTVPPKGNTERLGTGEGETIHQSPLPTSTSTCDCNGPKVEAVGYSDTNLCHFELDMTSLKCHEMSVNRNNEENHVTKGHPCHDSIVQDLELQIVHG